MMCLMYRTEKIYESVGGPLKYHKSRKQVGIRLVKTEQQHKLVEFDWYLSFVKSCQESRLALGLTQYQLGHGIGTTQAAISRFEAGRVAPTVEFIDRLATALGKKARLTLEK